MTNYKLKSDIKKPVPMLSTIQKFAPLLSAEKGVLIKAFVALLINSLANLIVPFLVAHAIDTFIQAKQYAGLVTYAGLLLLIFLVALIASYLQTKLMGGMAQRLLFKLRDAVFTKLQELPVEFFNQNKAGDLISRINNDTDKLNQFFSQALMQFIGNIVMIAGTAIFIIWLNPTLGLLSLLPAVIAILITRILTPWIKSKNARVLTATGGMSAEIQESLDNFKVVVAFNRRDYFRERFNDVNEQNFSSAVAAGLASNIFIPIYGLASNVAQVIVLFYGTYLITTGNFTVGLLIGYFSYMSRVYDPMRQIAALWSSLQVALAGWDRITAILSLNSNLNILPATTTTSTTLVAFDHVSFSYSDGQPVLKNINFTLERGKTYALVGPTGGGKTTTASLMARLFDPTSGQIYFDGHDIRTLSSKERTKKIGVILQEPILFTGTVRDNILYGNDLLMAYTDKKVIGILQKFHLEHLVDRFSEGFDTKVESHGDSISLGQKQVIAFIRAVLRNPDLLILDEATANIDTMTEQLLDEILTKLPSQTTRVIIAHRLNTIERADEIFFVNAGEISRAGSLDQALALLLNGKRES